MDISLYMGKLIHCDLTYGNMASWSYWTSFAQEKWGQKNRFYLLRMNTQGDNNNESYGDIQNGGTITDNSNLWVLATTAVSSALVTSVSTISPIRKKISISFWDLPIFLQMANESF